MPEIWRSCLRGEGEINLRGARVLSEGQYLWTSAGIGSRLVGAAASRVIRTEVARVEREEAAPFAGAPRGVDVYRVEEQVLDPRSVVGAIAERHAGCILQTGNPECVQVRLDGAHVHAAVAIGAPGDGTVEIGAGAVVLAGGAGNEALLEMLRSGAGASARNGHAGPGDGRPAWAPPKMQRRPLHMVMARGGDLPELFGHCIGLSDKPRITVTTQRQTEGAGGVVWYIGGQLSEDGVGRTEAEQVEAAKAEVRACLPWIDLSGTGWATLRVDRAEGLTDRGTRPDEPLVRALERVAVVWPTKLAFAPAAAAGVMGCIDAMGFESRSAQPNLTDYTAQWGLALLPWEEGSVRWHS
jgi:glycerol-3-phosphate dehydrogenase